MNQTSAPIPEAIAETAADWIVRRDGGPLSPGDEHSFQAWLADPVHRDAFERLDGLWSTLDAATVPPLPAARPSAPRRTRAVPVGRRGRAAAAIAASLALFVLGTLEDWTTRLRADHATGIGERRTVRLEDGSTVELDGDSAIALDFSARRRGVRLLAGAAMFRVAPDRSRPFTVEAAGGSATALGTAFAVRERDGLAELVVTEHRVRVVGDGRSHLVGEGQQAAFGADALGRVEPAGIGATAWTRGRLVVVDRPLGEVVAEIARHRRGYLTAAASIADMRVSGVYDLDHPLAAIDNIERSLHLGSFRLSDRIIVLHR